MFSPVVVRLGFLLYCLLPLSESMVLVGNSDLVCWVMQTVDACLGECQPFISQTTQEKSYQM